MGGVSAMLSCASANRMQAAAARSKKSIRPAGPDLPSRPLVTKCANSYCNGDEKKNVYFAIINHFYDKFELSRNGLCTPLRESLKFSWMRPIQEQGGYKKPKDLLKSNGLLCN